MTDNVYDCFILGAGFGGIDALKKLRDGLGLNCILADMNSGPGGTWFSNRYPGAMSDTLAHIYRLSWDKDALQGLWERKYSRQPEVLAYLNALCDRHDLRKDMRFDTEMLDGLWSEETCQWTITTNRGIFVARYLITSLGLLSAINFPDIKGLDTFKGKLVHTGRWDHDIDLRGKRVGVIGNGSTGVQLITKIAPEVKQLWCFQRNPQYSVPAGDAPVSDEDRAKVLDNWDQVWRDVAGTATGFGFQESAVPLFSVPEEERQRRLEEVWQIGGGFRFMFGAFCDVATDENANEYVAQFLRNKIAQIVKDPVKRAKVTPQDYYARRPICDSGYFETFNRDNVDVHDLKEDPIVEVLPEGVKTAQGKVYELDVLVFATGFNAVDGNYNRISFRNGESGPTLKQKWFENPQAYMGMFPAGFPNLIMLLGPGTVFSSNPPAIEAASDFLVDLLKYANGRSICAKQSSEDQWVQLCESLAKHSLFFKVDSWIAGINADRAKAGGRAHVVQFYVGGIAGFRKLTKDVEENGFKEFDFGAPVH